MACNRVRARLAVGGALSGIFGIVRRDGAPLDPQLLGKLRACMTGWDRDGCGLWSDDNAGLGQARTFATPEDSFEHQPVLDSAGFAFTSEARLDNAAALKTELDLPRNACDGDVALSAYRRWGVAAPARLLGDWSFAAWHPDDRRLFVARDHYGQTSVYWSETRELVAFASSRVALQKLGLAPVRLDELYIAQYLISWAAYHGERTSDDTIRRLPPAHALTVTSNDARAHCYWRMEEHVKPVVLPTRADYVELFREVFDEAVRSRMRTAGALGAELSGGLDSSSVVSTAAALLRGTGERIQGFTSVPIGDVSTFAGERFGDELPLAQATARAAGMIDVHPVTAADLSPVGAIRRYLDLAGSPMHAAANAHWLVALPVNARARGCTVLLSGRKGNAGFSWEGRWRSQPFRYHAAAVGPARAVLSRALCALPPQLALAVDRRRRGADGLQASAAHPDLVRRLDIDRLRRDEGSPDRRSPTAWRFAILMPERFGTLSPEIEAAAGVAVVDPTADVRVLTLALGLPDHVFIEPRSGVDRWIAREAMRERVPDAVRSNRRRGLQAADFVLRLRGAKEEVESVLDDLQHGPSAAYVDVPAMRATWRTVQDGDGYPALVAAMTVLGRGIMAGLHVNDLIG